MATTSWTVADLNALEQAIAQGALRVKYADKEVEYRTLDDMLQIRRVITDTLGLGTSPGSGRRYAQFSKGIE